MSAPKMGLGFKRAAATAKPAEPAPTPQKLGFPKASKPVENPAPAPVVAPVVQPEPIQEAIQEAITEMPVAIVEELPVEVVPEPIPQPEPTPISIAPVEQRKEPELKATPQPVQVPMEDRPVHLQEKPGAKTPGKMKKIVLILAGVAVLGVGGFFGYRTMYPMGFAAMGGVAAPAGLGGDIKPVKPKTEAEIQAELEAFRKNLPETFHDMPLQEVAKVRDMGKDEAEAHLQAYMAKKGVPVPAAQVPTPPAPVAAPGASSIDYSGLTPTEIEKAVAIPEVARKAYVDGLKAEKASNILKPEEVKLPPAPGAVQAAPKKEVAPVAKVEKPAPVKTAPAAPAQKPQRAVSVEEERKAKAALIQMDLQKQLAAEEAARKGKSQTISSGVKETVTPASSYPSQTKTAEQVSAEAHAKTDAQMLDIKRKQDQIDADNRRIQLENQRRQIEAMKQQYVKPAPPTNRPWTPEEIEQQMYNRKR